VQTKEPSVSNDYNIFARFARANRGPANLLVNTEVFRQLRPIIQLGTTIAKARDDKRQKGS